jgi:nicotinate-nucleotide pyrophosphorylase (carboxylating)
MSPQQLAQAVALRDGAGYAAKLEASGGVNLDSIRAIAASGVDYISVGADHECARGGYWLGLADAVACP